MLRAYNFRPRLTRSAVARNEALAGLLLVSISGFRTEVHACHRANCDTHTVIATRTCASIRVREVHVMLTDQ